MTRPEPGTPEWCALVTASKVAAILGLSPWDSPLSMWLKMAGRAPWDSESPAMRRGTMLENAVLDWFLADHPECVELERQPWYFAPDEGWAGATPDMLVRNDYGHPADLELVDAKTASTDEHWGHPGDEDAVPNHYLVSSMWQLAMAPEARRVHLAVLFGSPFDIRYYTVQRDDELCDALIDRAREFHQSLAADNPPPLSGMACEYDAIRKANPDIDRGATAVLPAALVEEYVAAHRAAKSLDGLKAAVLDVMGNAQYATDEHGNRIARRQPSKGAVALYFTATTDPQENAA